MVGRTLGKYRIVDHLGAGGMGVVYRAVDQTLDREVAIKLVPEHLVGNADAHRRFLQEARLLSRLNHPNIAALYEFERDGEAQFLVMELVHGESLRTRLEAGPLPVSEVCRLGTQLAAGLAAAHDMGIVHRDLKPENLLITPQAQLKILDFGVARRTPAASADAATATAALTEAHTVSGTLPYMAPEQLRGEPADPRSDIYSACTVLYEMTTGRHPFAGRAGAVLIDAVLNRDPQPASASRRAVPPALDGVLLKGLDKQPERRYQSARELAVDLERVSVPGRVVGAAAPAVANAGHARAIAAAVLLLGLLTAAYVVFVFGHRSSPQLEYVQLTNFTDSSTSPALSPDGRMLAFVRGESTFYGSGHIYAKLLPDGDAVQLTQEDAGRADPAFTPDGSRITFSEGSRPENPFGAVLSVATLGGQPPRLVASSIISMTTFELTPGQRRVLYSEFTGHGAQLAIVTASESRTDRRVIYMPPEPYGMAHRSAISPDRRHVLVSAEMNVDNWLPCRVVPYDGGAAPRFVGPVPSQCTDAAWSPDGRWMYFTANTGRGFHVWRQPFPQGEVEQVTAGTTEEEGIDFAPDGRSFVTAIGNRQSTIWVHDARGDRQITSEGYGLLPTFSPDVTKLYYMRKTSAIGSWASASLWVADLRTGERQPVLPDVLMQTYDISHDGKRVVFAAAGDTEDTPVWIAALDGSTPPRRLAVTPAMSTFFGPHGDVFFQSREGAGAMYSVNEDGTNLRKRMDLADIVSLSADGRWIGKYSMPGAWVAQSMDGERTVRISRGSPLPGTFEAAPWSAGLSWTRDGRFMYVRPNNFATYALPLRPGAVVPDVPAEGFQSEQEVAAFAGARLVARGPNVFPGPTPDVYAFTKVATQRNIYRVILR